MYAGLAGAIAVSSLLIIFSGVCSKVVNLVINHYDGGYQARKYFKELGHKKALCIADNFICMDKERKEYKSQRISRL